MSNTRQIFSSAIQIYQNALENDIADPVWRRLGQNPPLWEALRSTVKTLESAINMNSSFGRTNLGDFHQIELELLKAALVHHRQSVADKNAKNEESTHNAEIRNGFASELKEISEIIEWESFSSVDAYKPPKLTDYLTVQAAEDALQRKEDGHLLDRIFDEKFHILMSPNLFFHDLTYFRARCDLRGLSVAVAFIDIDDFKSFNSRMGEVTVDLLVLPRIMEVFESHVYSHGFAYRYGGDEYAMILPNTAGDDAEISIKKLQQKLSGIKFDGIVQAPTISVGIVIIDEESDLIGREILKLAQEAKDKAKADGKNRIELREV